MVMRDEDLPRHFFRARLVPTLVVVASTFSGCLLHRGRALTFLHSIDKCVNLGPRRAFSISEFLHPMAAFSLGNTKRSLSK